ncbi:molybdopterin-guanine dinucleotide biosynthesis protein A [Haloactinopolyspora alba]|uniref:Molybdopterin-guanine dinucleotide biosynthesis protein A n=1 Tax=Haloactinopolyspora alba TaxID=648780 RepID=A0A2P8E6Z3_9ACTN|nr:NTP transferase domain-containing protein [Haloactinopolyspora alba]PSL05208.1 molybdopterin-guanine dinucleotide biosynthesis protein A [Haloactinopolyspora alba]
MTPPWAALVLAGGGARRLGGRDKPALVVGGRTLLDRAVDSCVDAGELVVVGPPRPTDGTPLRWTREEPPGSGPLAALAAGLDALLTDPPVVVVLAADLPAVTPELVRGLVEALPAEADALLVTDADGRLQPLLGVYRRPALTAALRGVGDPRGRPLHRILPSLTVATVPDARASSDIDTAQDLARWQTRPAEGNDGAPTDMERDD